MLSVSLPIWLIIAAAGLPAVLFLFIGILLVRLKRRNRKRRGVQTVPDFINTPVQFNNQVYKQLVEQQIDAVFNTLITVIESERMKLKALVGNPALPADTMTTSMPKHAMQEMVNERTDTDRADQPANSSDQSLGQSIAAMSKKGMTAEQIARQLGLSQTEMSLAIKMNNSRKSGVGTKVRSVA